MKLLVFLFFLIPTISVAASVEKPATQPSTATAQITAMGSSVKTKSRGYDASNEVRSCAQLAGDRDYEVKVVRNKDGVSAFCRIDME